MHTNQRNPEDEYVAEELPLHTMKVCTIMVSQCAAIDVYIRGGELPEALQKNCEIFCK